VAKVINCSDLGSDCEFAARGETLEEVLAVGPEHAKEAHGISEITPKILERVKQALRDE
jgi:predicted small metal-binding protein